MGGGGLFCDDGFVSCGTVFSLRPAASACKTALCPWTETLAYNFDQLENQAAYPFTEVTFDPSGNMYLPTVGDNGGGPLYGDVIELTPFGGGWNGSVLYSFTGNEDGANVSGGVTLDASGNVYGVTQGGGAYGYGVIFRLTSAGSGWIENVLYNFQAGSDGWRPYGGLIFDQKGNLYGVTSRGGTGNGGTVFELSPSNGSWTLTTLYGLSGPDSFLARRPARHGYGG